MVMQRFHNLPRLKLIRKNLRATMTPAEIALWKQLQDSQLQGHKFRRQHSVGSYIVDFIALQKNWRLSWMAHHTIPNKVFSAMRKEISG